MPEGGEREGAAVGQADLDTLRPTLARIARVAKTLFGAPLADIAIFQGQTVWRASDRSADGGDDPASALARLGDAVLWVEDLAEDARFSSHPAVTGVPHLRFYAGAPIRLEDGTRIGALAIYGMKPRARDEAMAERLRDLADIVGHECDRISVIAERARLSESVTDILVERGDRTVLTTVSANEGAVFSDRGFDRLLERGNGDAAIAGNLARRSDLAPKRAERVLRIVEQLADGAASASSDSSQSLARQARQQRLEAKLLLSDLAAKVREVDDVLTMLADEDRAYHLAQVLSQVADITPEQALRVLMQRDASGIAVTCRSLGVGLTAFRAILQLRARRLYFSPRDVDDDVDAYAKLDLATAERTLRFLKLKTKIA